MTDEEKEGIGMKRGCKGRREGGKETGSVLRL